MTQPDHEVVIIGAGPGGIASAYLLQRRGIDDFVIIERGDDFGGTWRDNHYPGLAVDIPSLWYQLSFAPNPDAYDPHYHFQLAIDAGLNAYAAPLGMIEAGAGTFAGAIPTILKVNSSNSLMPKAESPNQALTASVSDALRLGCAALGFTIYPGSAAAFDMMEDIREMAEEAKAVGLSVVIWSYPRGEAVSCASPVSDQRDANIDADSSLACPSRRSRVVGSCHRRSATPST